MKFWQNLRQRNQKIQIGIEDLLKENEIISNYDLKITRMAITCNFAPFLHQLLTDRFVFGLWQARMQREIITKGRTFE